MSLNIRSWCLLATGGLLALVAAACGGSGSDPTPTVPAPEVSPVPSGTVIDLERADALYEIGDYDQALTIYSAAAQDGDTQQKQRGLWRLGQIQAERGENGAAERTLRAYRATQPHPDDDRLALLLLGTTEFVQGDFDGAEEAFEEYIAAGGAAWPYAQLYLAQIARQEDRTNDAIEMLNAALLADLPPSTQVEALFTLAEIYSGKGDTANTFAAYDRAFEAAETSGDAADALSRKAQAAGHAGDAAAGREALASLVRRYPGDDRALDALNDPRVSADPSITTRDRALVLFRHQLNEEAAVAFQSIVDAGGEGVAEAHYYLGILAERAALWDEAIAHYDATVAALAPGADDTLRAQATWDRATVLELLGRTDEAIVAYAEVGNILPTHEEAVPGAFRAGFLSYTAGRPGDAAVYWSQTNAIAATAEARAQANFWLAKAAEALGDPTGAAAYYAAAAHADPLDFYGLRAQAVLSGETAFPDSTNVPEPAPAWSAAETWIASWAGPEDPTARRAFFSGEPWLRALELHDAGLRDRAEEEFHDLLADHATEPWLVYRMAREIDERGRPWISSPAAAALLSHPGAPPEYLRLVYPLEFLEIVQTEAAINSVSPLLLLALVRQESLYDPGAISVADALGLTQVIEPTAEEIAQQLEIENFRLSDLLRPRTSLQFGAYYLGSQVTGFGGHLPAALAAYNGGPGNSGRWLDMSGGDRDLFVETIEFPETRAYVELVLENYARYLYAYGFTTTPSLPY